MDDSGVVFNARELILRVIPDMDERIDEFVVDGIELDNELLGVFVEQLTDNLSGLRDGMAAGDFQAVMQQAHSVKGMCGSIGLPEISVLARELEVQAGNGNADACAELARVLEECLRGYQARILP
ncbi:MAG: Hpt domain-containing protein [Spartobacteria bacterium]|nr:Hpt domain-containing protein [Spartobacteria bacterium]